MIVKVKGMHCESCEKLITMGIEDSVQGAKVKKAEWKTGTIDIDAPSSSLPAIKKAIEAEGYSIV